MTTLRNASTYRSATLENGVVLQALLWGNVTHVLLRLQKALFELDDVTCIKQYEMKRLKESLLSGWLPMPFEGPTSDSMAARIALPDYCNGGFLQVMWICHCWVS